MAAVAGNCPPGSHCGVWATRVFFESYDRQSRTMVCRQTLAVWAYRKFGGSCSAGLAVYTHQIAPSLSDGIAPRGQRGRPTQGKRTIVSSQLASGQSSASAAASAQNRKGGHSGLASDDLLQRVVSVLDENKAEDIVTIDLRDKSPLADHIVVASGRSQRQVQALADYVAKSVKVEMGTVKVEGYNQGDWVLIDLGDVVLHLFRPEVRIFYRVEAIWGMQTPEPAAAEDGRPLY